MVDRYGVDCGGALRRLQVPGRVDGEAAALLREQRGEEHRCSWRRSPATGSQHVVFSSTCAVYGTPEQVPVAEDAADPPGEPLRREQGHDREGALVVRPVPRPALGQPALLQCGGGLARRVHRRGLDRDHQPGPASDEGGPGPAAHLCRCTGPTTRRPTARRSATTSTSSTWPMPTSGPWSISKRAGRRRRSTWARASVRRCSRSLPAAEAVMGRPVPYDVAPRRPGDPVALYADTTLSQESPALVTPLRPDRHSRFGLGLALDPPGRIRQHVRRGVRRAQHGGQRCPGARCNTSWGSGRRRVLKRDHGGDRRGAMTRREAGEPIALPRMQRLRGAGGRGCTQP